MNAIGHFGGRRRGLGNSRRSLNSRSTFNNRSPGNGRGFLQRTFLAAETEQLQDQAQLVAGAAHDGHHLGPDPERASTSGAGGRLGGGFGGLPCGQRPDDIGEPLQHIDAHRTQPAHMETGGAVEGLRHGGVARHRGQPLARRFRDGGRGEVMLGSVLQQPEQQQQVGGRGLQQQRKIDMMRAEPHAVFPELRPAFLIDGLDLVGHHIALQHAEALAQAESDALREPRYLLGLRDFL